jgi:adenylate cyclase
MPQVSTTMAVLFADIAGSTKLYDTLGDVRAKAMIDECITLMRGIVAQYGGRVIKTIGDEVMCVLPDADAGCLAATDMQLKIMALPAASDVKRAIRAGFHAGPVIEEHNDVFGDTVNLAARMAGLAKAMQIITTQATVDQLSPMLRSSTRSIAALAVKGKGDDVAVCEVIWQGGEELTMATPSILTPVREAVLLLRHGGTERVLDQGNASLVLGRDAGCQVVIADRMASRQHARLERRRDKFYLIDQSTNGTFVRVAGEAEIVLRREEVMLRGQGHIAFGRSADEAGAETAEFEVRE